MRIISDRPNRKIWIYQDSYIGKIMNKYGLQGRAIPDTPMAIELLIPYDGVADPKSRALYQSKVGSIIYPMSISRPDIAFTSSTLAHFMQNPGPEHHKAIDRVIRYLAGTKHHALQFEGIDEATVSIFEGPSDASFADVKEPRVSSHSRYYELFRGSID